MEYDVTFDTADDAMDRLRKENDILKKEYRLLYEAFKARLEDDKGKKMYYIDKNPKDLNDIKTVENSIKQARIRTLGVEGE